ncbi:hypothetical protein [Mobiluncus mulieris]|uniref:Uncharacterized protein n=1 Tax=Mobiluncus mulieris TaxID=2052 RepID=A0A2J9KSE8_9ACTO|nr:hypothetical protein [Mobiluncus mulieris]EEJ54746.1 hypothetical protein HMPREF0577_0269 [Mobiluncus mulieris ATCC 35243]MBB5846663.1 hypothetical protein [Mobiluncus mulieris]MCV0002088.1 hypothetical protein [Mobiluncus mulieris]MCV0011805.1 hypothetical protein [Mobiluncus mulieris]NMW65696.1 hypothetical protein [Mobiluncus mulieris]
MEVLIVVTASSIGLIGLLLSIFVWKFVPDMGTRRLPKVAIVLAFLLALGSMYLPEFMYLKFGGAFDPDVRDFLDVSFLPIFKGYAVILAVVTLAGLVWGYYRSGKKQTLAS